MTNDNDDLFAPLPRSLFAITTQLLAAAQISAAAKFDASDKGAAGDSNRGDANEEHERTNREYVDQRSREIRAFEEQARGIRRRARRGGPGVGLERNALR